MMVKKCDKFSQKPSGSWGRGMLECMCVCWVLYRVWGKGGTPKFGNVGDI